jgi:hypothetical protein
VQALVTPAAAAAIARLLLQRVLSATAVKLATSMQQQQQQQGADGAAAAPDGGSGTSLPAGATTTGEEQACKVVGWIGSLCNVPCLRPAVMQLPLQDLQGAQHAASQLMAALPEACPISLAPFVFQWAWKGAVEVLMLPLAAAEEQQQLSDTERAACQRQAAVNAARCLPRLAAALRAAPASHAHADSVLAAMCALAQYIVGHIAGAMPAFATEQQAADCVALLEAADALLRTLPTLQRAQQVGEQQQQEEEEEEEEEQQQQQGQPTAVEQPGQEQEEEEEDFQPAEQAARAAAGLSSLCLLLLRDAAQLACSLLQPDGRFDLHLRPIEKVAALDELNIHGRLATSTVALAAWQAHTTVCRWVHWTAAQGNTANLAEWHPVLQQLGSLCESLPPSLHRNKRGAMAAHLAAVEALAETEAPLQQWQPALAQQWAVHLAWLATHFDEYTWPPQLGELLVAASSLLVEVSTRLSMQCVAWNFSRLQVNWLHAGHTTNCCVSVTYSCLHPCPLPACHRAQHVRQQMQAAERSPARSVC